MQMNFAKSDERGREDLSRRIFGINMRQTKSTASEHILWSPSPHLKNKNEILRE